MAFFTDRIDAGKRLASELKDFTGKKWDCSGDSKRRRCGGF